VGHRWWTARSRPQRPAPAVGASEAPIRRPQPAPVPVEES